MSSGQFKQDLFAQFAKVAKALAHGNRLELLEFLAQGERSVEELARVSGLTMANTSQHLQQLRQVGLVATRKEGVKVIYRLRSEEVVTLMGMLRDVAERQLAEVDRLVSTYLNAKDRMEPIRGHELMERVRDGSALVLDVRPAAEYAAGHLPGAINVPLKELERRIAELPTGQEIVAYCRGPYCVLAFDAVARLRQEGRSARRLEYGLPEWKQAGLPVEY
ncbi:MAG: ArsR family transcriptional regulator [Gammaproteobacteria bacterium]|nr:MAG: ArsR family transcriptional regulator [Gammaproteobacteria bacterium]